MRRGYANLCMYEICTGYCGKHRSCVGGAFDDSCKFVVNPYDEYGVEEVKQIEIGVLPVNYYKKNNAIGA